jgi:L-ornithine N5-oxygenase
MAPSAISTPLEEINDHYSSNIISDPTSMRLLNLPRTLSTTNPYSSSDMLDLLCIGFGPASLAIAIALNDSFSPTAPGPKPKTLFLEKQPQFAWHAGMQLPGAKMQISFLKDLATPRDPRSKFTFTNYLFTQGRLNQFINLGTFLPSRMEYEDYLRWCARHFEREGKVAYGMEVDSVRPASTNPDGKVTSWEVSARDGNGNIVVRKARHVVVAVGGKPIIPAAMQDVKHVAHSSRFATTIGQIEEREKMSGRKPRFAVVGSGQSAAEIFNDLWSRFPESEVKLIIRGASLRPSDDSPLWVSSSLFLSHVTCAISVLQPLLMPSLKESNPNIIPNS